MSKKDPNVYDGSSIQVLDQIEHIRLRPDNYIGDTSLATHLLIEGIDNSMDEIINGFGTKMGVFIDDKNHSYTVIDNGRGIPIDMINGIDVPVILSTTLFSGGKFNKDSYKVSAGLNGIGLVAVNALSTKMEIEINRVQENRFGKKLMNALYVFENTKLIKQEYKELDNKDVPFSTRITFTPNKDIFESCCVDIDYVVQRLSIGSIFTGKEMLLNHNGQAYLIKQDLKTYFIDQFTKAPLFDPIIIHHKVQNQQIDMIFAYESSDDPYKIHSSVNLLPVQRGTHINALMNTFLDVFSPWVKEDMFLKNDCLVGLRVYFNVYLEKTAFSSQTKNELTVRKNAVDPIINDNLKNLILQEIQKRNLLDMLIAKFENYRLSLKAKTVKKDLDHKQGLRGKLNKDSKLKDCRNPSVDGTELIIIEGDSAGGTCIQARDPEFHAILPLKGKIMNVATKKDIDMILKNKEIQDIIRCLGIGYKSKTTKVDINNIRYGKIILCPDPDADGSHICSLLMLMFMLMAPEVIEYGHLYVADMPLYGFQKGKEFYPIWSLQELDEMQKKYPSGKATRFKGLGEMEASQLRPCLLDSKTRRLYQVKSVEQVDKDYLVSLFIDARVKRELIVLK